jgi:hypothetical protein
MRSRAYYESLLQQSVQIRQRHADLWRMSQQRLARSRQALDQSSHLLSRSRLRAQATAEPKGLLAAGALEKV